MIPLISAEIHFFENNGLTDKLLYWFINSYAMSLIDFTVRIPYFYNKGDHKIQYFMEQKNYEKVNKSQWKKKHTQCPFLGKKARRNRNLKYVVWSEVTNDGNENGGRLPRQ